MPDEDMKDKTPTSRTADKAKAPRAMEPEPPAAAPRRWLTSAEQEALRGRLKKRFH